MKEKRGGANEMSAPSFNTRREEGERSPSPLHRKGEKERR